jgi:dTDP-4-amino-4,6-dideoxygalactose transaminase
MLNFYRDRFGLKPDDFPASRDSDRQSMAIPLHNRLTREDYDYVIENLRSFGR